MKIRYFLLFVLLFIVAMPVWTQTKGLVFVVNDNSDTHDAIGADNICADLKGHCTLRAAIEEANANGTTTDAIMFSLAKPATIDLTLGELNILRGVTIIGPGARELTVQRSFAAGTPLFRVFHVGEFNFPGGGGSTIRGLTIRNGRIEGALFGGGILVERQNWLFLNDVMVKDNFALYGGGLSVDGTAVVSRCLFSGNTGNNYGGGVYVRAFVQAKATITNTTITGNSGAVSGAIDNGGELLLVNNTISQNQATDFCTSICNRLEGTTTVLNTIIANDTSPTVTPLGGTFISLGNNLISDARSSTGFVNGINNDQVSENNAINPLLGILRNNGGQTDSRSLSAGSPAINTGNDCVFTGACGLPIIFTSDQRQAYGRKFGSAVDIGAVESSASRSSAPWASGPIRVGYPGAFFANSISSLTNAQSGETIYARTKPSGYVNFQDLEAGAVYLLDIYTKRQMVYFSPQIVEQK